MICPRCKAEHAAELYGPCGACRDDLRDKARIQTVAIKLRNSGPPA